MMKDIEILENLKDTASMLEAYKETFGDITVPINITMVIQELIGRYTPRAPKGTTRKRYCSVCGRRIRDGNGNCRTRDIRCQKCGQIIEWGN